MAYICKTWNFTEVSASHNVECCAMKAISDSGWLPRQYH